MSNMMYIQMVTNYATGALLLFGGIFIQGNALFRIFLASLGGWNVLLGVMSLSLIVH